MFKTENAIANRLLSQNENNNIEIEISIQITEEFYDDYCYEENYIQDTNNTLMEVYRRVE